METNGIETTLQARVLLVLTGLGVRGIDPPRASVACIKRIGDLGIRPASTLRRMITMGLVEEHREMEPTLYSATASGAAALEAWSRSAKVTA